MAATSRFDSYLKYELEHPIAKSLPSGTFIPPYLVGEIYTIKEELEDRDYEIAFLKGLIETEPTAKPQNVGSFFNFTINGFNVRLIFEDEHGYVNPYNLSINASFNEHVEYLYSPDIFIKDYEYLVKRFGLNATQLQENEAYRYTKQLHIEKFFYENILAAYSMIIVIGNIIRKIFNFWNNNYVPRYPQDIANTTLETRYLPIHYLPGLQNKPVNVLKVYIRALNKLLLKLRGYKILLNPNITNKLNRRLNLLSEYLVEPDSRIANQANAKFNIRVLENGSKFPKKQRSYTPRKKLKSTTQKRALSL